MFINPSSVSLKWPILICSPLVEKQHVSPWFAFEITTLNISEIDKSKDGKKLIYRFVLFCFSKFIYWELPGGRKSHIIVHMKIRWRSPCRCRPSGSPRRRNDQTRTPSNSSGMRRETASGSQLRSSAPPDTGEAGCPFFRPFLSKLGTSMALQWGLSTPRVPKELFLNNQKSKFVMK